MTCKHEKTSTLSSGPPLFTPALHDDGRPVLFCLDCHAASDQPEWLSQPAATPYPRGVSDPIGPRGEPIQTSTDRRLLWHLEAMLSVSGTTETHRQERNRLRKYLHETCAHEWLDYAADEGYAPAHNQCLWCNEVDWLETPQQPSSAVLPPSEPVEVAGEGSDAEGGAE